MYIFRRGLRLRGKRQQEAGDSSPAEAEEEGNKEEEEKTEKEEKEKNEGGEDEESDCEVCPGMEASDFSYYLTVLLYCVLKDNPTFSEP